MGISGFTTTTRSEEIGTGISLVKIFFKVGNMAFCFTRIGIKRNSCINVKEHLDTNSYRPYCKDHDELHERDSQTAQILSCSSMMSTNIIFPDSKIYSNIYACWQQLFLWVSAVAFFCSCFFICQIYMSQTIASALVIDSRQFHLKTQSSSIDGKHGEWSPRKTASSTKQKVQDPSSRKFIPKMVQGNSSQLLANDMPFANCTCKRL